MAWYCITRASWFIWQDGLTPGLGSFNTVNARLTVLLSLKILQNRKSESKEYSIHLLKLPVPHPTLSLYIPTVSVPITDITAWKLAIGTLPIKQSTLNFTKFYILKFDKSFLIDLTFIRVPGRIGCNLVEMIHRSILLINMNKWFVMILSLGFPNQKTICSVKFEMSGFMSFYTLWWLSILIRE